jgi:hypothetical protein
MTVLNDLRLALRWFVKRRGFTAPVDVPATQQPAWARATCFTVRSSTGDLWALAGLGVVLGALAAARVDPIVTLRAS